MQPRSPQTSAPLEVAPSLPQRDQVERPDLAEVRELRAALRQHRRTAVERHDDAARVIAFFVAVLVHAGLLLAAWGAPETETQELRRARSQRRVLDGLRVERAVFTPDPREVEEVSKPPVEPPTQVAAPVPPSVEPTPAAAVPPPRTEVARATPRIKHGKPKQVRKAAPRQLTSRAEAAPASAPAAASPPTTAGSDLAAGGSEQESGDGGSPDGTATEGADAGRPDGTGAGPATDAPPSIDLAALLRTYKRKVSKALRRDFTYPRAAVRQGLEGTVVLELTIDDRGEVRDSRVARSSGHPVLDEAALEAVRRIHQLPEPPRELEWGRRSIQVPFHYRLGA